MVTIYTKYTLSGEYTAQGIEQMREKFPEFYNRLVSGEVKVGPIARMYLKKLGVEIPENQNQTFVGEFVLETDDFKEFSRNNTSNAQTTLDALLTK